MTMPNIYWDYFTRVEVESSMEHTKRLYSRIKERTGLDDKLIPLYELFLDNTTIPEGIVMPDDVKHRMMQRSAKSMGKEYCTELWPIVQKAYGEVYLAFRKHGLMIHHVSSSGQKLPKVIGYNYFDDPEFYFAFRKNGDTVWRGRMLISKTDRYELVKLITSDHEIREKKLLHAVMN